MFLPPLLCHKTFKYDERYTIKPKEYIYIYIYLNFCTCAYKTGAASLNEIIIVRQDEGAPLLHLQAILATGDSLSAVNLGGLEVLRTQPLLINHLEERQREEDRWGVGGIVMS